MTVMALTSRVARSIDGRCRRIFRSWVWPYLPRSRNLVFNGVTVNIVARRLATCVPTRWLPAHVADIETFESASVQGLKRCVRNGDTVVIVGGGFGVTAVWAARLVGRSGKAHCFEAAKDRVVDVIAAARLNDVADRLTVRHAVVGEALLTFGTTGDAPRVRPKDLPGCDVLEMDCEGAELAILDELEIRPRDIVVETHGFNGAPTHIVCAKLISLGYDVVDLGVAVAHKRGYCEANDIKVLLASRREVVEQR